MPGGTALDVHGDGQETGRRESQQNHYFFNELLEEIEGWGIAAFDRRTIVLNEEFRTRDGASLSRME